MPSDAIDTRSGHEAGVVELLTAAALLATEATDEREDDEGAALDATDDAEEPNTHAPNASPCAWCAGHALSGIERVFWLVPGLWQIVKRSSVTTAMLSVLTMMSTLRESSLIVVSVISPVASGTPTILP